VDHWFGLRRAAVVPDRADLAAVQTGVSGRVAEPEAQATATATVARPPWEEIVMIAAYSPISRPHRLLVFSVGLLVAVASNAGGQYEVIDSPMYRNPDVPLPPVELVFPDGLKELWLRALGRPEVELRLNAASAIAQAHERGMKGLDSTVAPLIMTLDAADQNPAVRLAAAQALLALDARKAAPNLLAQAQSGDVDLREAVEPALARWDYRPARAMWLARLNAPATPAASLVLAIRGLATVREEQAVPRLLALVASEEVAGPIRLEAARALGDLRDDGLEKDAETLAAAPTRGIVARLGAAHLLRRHKGPAATAILGRLARDPEPAVTALAAGRLIEIDPELAVPVLEHLLGSLDADVRSLGALVLFRLPTKERIGLLSDRLADVHPDVRKKARAHLKKLGENKELRQHVLDGGTRILAGKDWRGLEQAAILLAQLNHGPAAQRLVELLSADRPEIYLTAAWGLRVLAVRETLEPVKKYVEAEFGRLLAAKALPGRKNFPSLVDHQLSQLNQLLGLMKYEPAEALLRQFIPKQFTLGESRPAAIWALGLLHDAKVDPAFVAALEGRLNDAGPMKPERSEVRLMAAVTLGRMKAKQALPSLKKFWRGRLSDEPLNNACGWAVEQITGEPIPPAVPTRILQQSWFLVPL
jgi:HEAT repeat protein